MHKYDYSFLENGLLPAELVNISFSISSLKTAAEFRKADYATIFTELENVAKIQSVKSSNEMEGIVTSDERIAQIVSQNSRPLNHNEQEISGYRDVLNAIHANFQNLKFNEETILSFHKTLMSYTNSEFAGIYKKDDNLILEIDSLGNRKIRFAPVYASETKTTSQLTQSGSKASSEGMTTKSSMYTSTK